MDLMTFALKAPSIEDCFCLLDDKYFSHLKLLLLSPRVFGGGTGNHA